MKRAKIRNMGGSYDHESGTSCLVNGYGSVQIQKEYSVANASRSMTNHPILPYAKTVMYMNQGSDVDTLDDIIFESLHFRHPTVGSEPVESNVVGESVLDKNICSTRNGTLESAEKCLQGFRYLCRGLRALGVNGWQGCRGASMVRGLCSSKANRGGWEARHSGLEFHLVFLQTRYAKYDSHLWMQFRPCLRLRRDTSNYRFQRRRC